MSKTTQVIVFELDGKRVSRTEPIMKSFGSALAWVKKLNHQNRGTTRHAILDTLENAKDLPIARQ